MKVFRRFGLVVSMFLGLNVSAQSHRVMLVESFTNAGCMPCAQQNPAFDSLIETNIDRLAVIKYHTHWPLATDPMYLSNAADIDARTGFYNVATVPTAILDGNRYYSAPSGINQNIINQLLNIPPRFEMRIGSEIQPVDNMITIRVEGEALSSVGGDLQLFVALVERETHFDAPPGTNGETDFLHVLKEFLTDASGLDLGSLEMGDHFDYTFDSKSTDNQGIENLSTIAWIQSRNTHEVYQACKHDLGSASTNESMENGIQVYPNPTDGIVNIRADGRKITLYNMLGQRFFESEGKDFLSIDLKPFGSGIYIVETERQTDRIVVK